MAQATGAAPVTTARPKDWLPGLVENAKFDAVSGFIIFLIALPLCLGISIASGAPPVAGVLTAIVGGILGAVLSGSHLTINGPAAGMIVVVFGVVMSLADVPGDAATGFKYALAVGVVCGLIQIVLGFLGAGAMTNMFNLSVVHGMLAGIGLIVLGKQVHVALGASAAKLSMVQTYGQIPAAIGRMMNDPILQKVALIGAIAIFIMAIWPSLGKISPLLGKIGKLLPAPLVIMLVTVPLAASFGLDKKYLVQVPLNFMDSFMLPDWSKVGTGIFWKGVFVYVFVASLESLLTASAIDKMDPWKRQSNMNRELVGKGSANALVSMIGGLPMIAEVVRSSANIMNGGRTRWANIFHGVFLLVAVAMIPAVLNMIPLAALAGMLVVIGFRLAHPKEFAHVAHIGKEELLFMVATTLGVVFIDLLWGVIGGMVLAAVVTVARGIPLRNAIVAAVAVQSSGNQVVVKLQSAAGFCNYLSIRRKLDKLPLGKEVVIDFSEAGFIDHTVRERLHDFESEYVARGGGSVTTRGLEEHRPTSAHPLSALSRA